jgi:hypothetical protein
MEAPPGPARHPNYLPLFKEHKNPKTSNCAPNNFQSLYPTTTAYSISAARVSKSRKDSSGAWRARRAPTCQLLSGARGHLDGGLKCLVQTGLNLKNPFNSNGFGPDQKPDGPVYWQPCLQPLHMHVFLSPTARYELTLI